MIRIKQLALAVGISAFASTAALASLGDPKIDFDTSAIPGAGGGGSPTYAFTYDDFVITDNAPSQVTQVDSDNSGGLSNGDAFSEFAVVSTVSFGLNDGTVNAFTSGVNGEYSLVTSVTLGGTVQFTGPNTLRVNFNSGSGMMVYDDSIGPDAGALPPTTVATLQNPTSGFCNVSISDESGSCVIVFDFEPTIAGLFVSQDVGDLLGNIDDALRVDINIDEVAGLLELIGGFAGYGDTCGTEATALCEAMLEVTHDGSARHMIPTPGTLALIGLGLLGLSRRRKQS